ncbi:MAG: ASKHA domain-containing protein [Lachnospiraceae bacterium]|nr:ASKHA domain-containing protein [Lachnospiraceae bacterium]
MSEQIKITVVMSDDKQNTEREEQKSKRILLTQDPFMTLLSVLQENRLLEESLCGGRGECGRCAVQFLSGATIPTPLERKHFSPEELRQGYRLACIARPRTDCVIKLLKKEGVEVPILTKTIPLSEDIDLNSQGKNRSENQTSGAMESLNGLTDEVKNNTGVMESGDHMIAVDLGTTTIAMQLYCMATGEVVDTYCEHNPQRSYGADVLSRIQASCKGRREELQRLVCESLLRGLQRFLTGRLIDAAQLRCICIAGNTAMEHLLMGYDVQRLGRSPFTPVEIGVQETTLSGLFACLAGVQIGENAALMTLPVYLTPGISAFVGGDMTAGLYALRMLPGFVDGKDLQAQDEPRVCFLIDLGTNGEIAITDGKRMLVTATAAGPAFEGSGESALIGTDRIALTASFLQRGILDETGLLAEPYFSEGVPVEAEDVRAAEKSGQMNTFRIRKEDIRSLQMAKAAIRAGIEILWVEMGCPRMDRVYLAGGFGYELDVEAAFAIGLLPVQLRGRVEAVGNTSLAGAFLMGRALWQGRIDRRALEEKLTSGTVIESINLAAKENFAALYLRYMNLEEN